MLGPAEWWGDPLVFALSIRDSANMKAKYHFGTLLKGDNFVEAEVRRLKENGRCVV